MAGTPWAERIAARIDGDGDGPDMLGDAMDWGCCSVAEKLGFPDVSEKWLESIIGEEAPQLARRGLDFFTAISNDEYKLAARIHRDIQSNYDDEAARIREAISEMVT